MKSYNEFLNDNNPRIEIVMENNSKMELELFPECAPITVENILRLVEKKFYDGIIFHRVIENFMIQGGDPTGTGMGGDDKKIKGEFRSNGVKNDLSHHRGVISMARTSMPNSASSQFFICHADALFLDGAYAAFGALVNGFETLDSIATTPTLPGDRPVNDQIIKTINIIR